MITKRVFLLRVCDLLSPLLCFTSNGSWSDFAACRFWAAEKKYIFIIFKVVHLNNFIFILLSLKLINEKN